MSLKYFFVYMMASAKRGTIYIGVTSDLLSRVRQHKDHLFKNSFTDRYDVTTLVWYEALGDPTHRPSSDREIGRFFQPLSLNPPTHQANGDWTILPLLANPPRAL
jgi:putative endonuclease